MSNPMSKLQKETAEFGEMYAMLAERQPALIPHLQASAAKLAAELTEVFQPFTDLADGRITLEEFNTIQDARQAAEQERRREHYEPGCVDGVVYPQCEHCLVSHEWVLADHDGEWPPIYFECEDVDGEPCDESLAANEDDEDA